MREAGTDPFRGASLSFIKRGRSRVALRIRRRGSAQRRVPLVFLVLQERQAAAA